jgi:histidinol-phosphate aminotransferase
MAPEALPRPGLRDLEPYLSPQPAAPVRLNTNECPRPLPAAFFDDLARAVRDLPLHRYPDGEMTGLREALARRHGHRLEGTWTANGSNEVLTELLMAYGGPGRRAAILEPTYVLHARLSRLTYTDVATLPLEPPFRMTTADVDAVVATDPDVVFVCSPNNPTGNAQPLERVAELAARTAALVIVDEAYIEFGGQTALPLVRQHGNVAVVRTFSKAFAMAGARLGYVLASPEVVADLRRVRLPYHMSALSQAAGLVALRHADDALSILGGIRAQRDRLLAELARIPGTTVFPSDGNFVLFVPPRPAADVWRGLLDRGVLVRDLSSVVPNALRVTAGTEDEVDRFLTALEEVLTR